MTASMRPMNLYRKTLFSHARNKEATVCDGVTSFWRCMRYTASGRPQLYGLDVDAGTQSNAGSQQKPPRPSRRRDVERSMCDNMGRACLYLLCAAKVPKKARCINCNWNVTDTDVLNALWVS
eukprot:TRINITY_DN7013_c0_g1_i4.p2 TRINITY_DN7013_c0_g1~~TRINITY_DN7013_c0_g1_i4.p2  ORF type:complete len:122 (-),score=6.00 TRINITY_DN7013_c0_g1_i4:589-954(-)